MAGRFAPRYKELQEDEPDYAVVAHRTMTTILKDFRQGGNDAVKLVLRVARHFQTIPEQPMLRRLEDWNQHRQSIENVAAMNTQNTRFTELAIDVCERQLDAIRFDGWQGDVRREMLKNLLMSYNDANFDAFAKIPPPRANCKVSLEEMCARVDQVRPEKERLAQKLADAIVKHRGIKNVHMPPSPNAKQSAGADEVLEAFPT
ncbi:MAG: hypothetical protein CYG59_14455 [Chloroflexi bacterium]|nr:MAG: hypothetical protein CYG59_14455 [Chloroflexota bacterium]